MYVSVNRFKRVIITKSVYCCLMNSSHRLRFSEGRNSLINLLASSSHSSFASAEKPRNSLSFSFERRWLYGIFFFGVSFIFMFHVFPENLFVEHDSNYNRYIESRIMHLEILQNLCNPKTRVILTYIKGFCYFINGDGVRL